MKEQQRIASKLNRIFANSELVRSELSRVSQLVERYKHSILGAAVRGDLPTNRKIRTRSNTTKIVPLEAVLAQIKTGPFGSMLHKSDYVSGGVPVVNPMHINSWTITPSAQISIMRKKAQQLSEFRLREGDVVIARRGEMGRCAVVGKDEAGWLCGTGSMILRPTNQVLPDYLQLFMSSPSTVAALEAGAVGSTMVNLNQKVLLSLAITLPSIEEQDEVVLIVKRAFDRIDHTAAEAMRALALLDRLDQAALTKAFLGELVAHRESDIVEARSAVNAK